MEFINIEIKAKINNHSKIKDILKSKNAKKIGIDHQIDTYFNVNLGRLKLREGNIENHLIYYQREDKKGIKQSNITLFKSNPKSSLKKMLVKALGVLIVVDKKREIYFIDNIKFHMDQVKNLGNFIEIEAVDYKNNIGRKKLSDQCKNYLDLLEIPQKDLISHSYSDLLLEKNI